MNLLIPHLVVKGQVRGFKSWVSCCIVVYHAACAIGCPCDTPHLCVWLISTHLTLCPSQRLAPFHRACWYLNTASPSPSFPMLLSLEPHSLPLFNLLYKDPVQGARYRSVHTLPASPLPPFSSLSLPHLLLRSRNPFPPLPFLEFHLLGEKPAASAVLLLPAPVSFPD